MHYVSRWCIIFTRREFEFPLICYICVEIYSRSPHAMRLFRWFYIYTYGLFFFHISVLDGFWRWERGDYTHGHAEPFRSLATAGGRAPATTWGCCRESRDWDRGNRHGAASARSEGGICGRQKRNPKAALSKEKRGGRGEPMRIPTRKTQPTKREPEIDPAKVSPTCLLFPSGTRADALDTLNGLVASFLGCRIVSRGLRGSSQERPLKALG